MTDVGISNNNPGYTLDIDGDINFTGQLTLMVLFILGQDFNGILLIPMNYIIMLVMLELEQIIQILHYILSVQNYQIF